ncbi:DUF6958 family protein [Virgibacillus senegalensis]|uniref:DUF6958 family protein n=1 Tax=Virgibacillus senegalensis TaxID=1499679 RepID=UPI00069DAA80|nr:hypothetical protein [Virgibacillus senegalensis]
MEMIQLQHPEGKQGARIRLDKYDLIKKEIVSTVRRGDGISYKQLTKEVNERLKGKFEGSVTWYVTAVKLDLEARDMIKRYTHKRLQYLAMTDKD